MLRSLAGPYRTLFVILLVCFAMSLISTVIIGLVTNTFMGVFPVFFGGSLFGIYFIFRTGSAYMIRIDRAAIRADLYMPVIFLFGISLAFTVGWLDTINESVTGMIAIYIFIMVYAVPRIIAGKKLTRLVGQNSSFTNVQFNSMNYFFWILGAPYIIRHTRLKRSKSDHP